MHFHDLPDTVQRAVRSLGEQARNEGVRLFVFGSFARGDARPNSDLDLGYEVPPGGLETPLAGVRLFEAVEQLPTIRPVDLVDFSQVSEAFRQRARKAVVSL
jgi:hypothetical protein